MQDHTSQVYSGIDSIAIERCMIITVMPPENGRTNLLLRQVKVYRGSRLSKVKVIGYVLVSSPPPETLYRLKPTQRSHG